MHNGPVKLESSLIKQSHNYEISCKLSALQERDTGGGIHDMGIWPVGEVGEGFLGINVGAM